MPSQYPFSDDLKHRLQQNLSEFDRHEIDDPSLRRAGVALVVAPRLEVEAQMSGACLLLTRRSRKLRRHAGQFALPGGRLDAGETFETAALRETREELALDYGPQAVLGALDDYQTKSGFVIRPFVIWGGPLDGMVPDPIEVATVFQIPLGQLDHSDIPQLAPGETPDEPVLGIPIAETGNTIHAPTAALIYQFREVAMHGRATRVAHFGEPQFAWK